MNPIVEEMQTYYARRAPVYDASMRYDDPEWIVRLAGVIESLQRQMHGRAVLELACGPGFWTRIVSDVALSITATDYNEATLAEARRKPLDWNKVTLLVADAYDLADLHRRFDGAFAVDWLAHVPLGRTHEFLRGLHEHLTPGARIVFCDQSARPESMTGIYDDEGNHVQQRTLNDGSSHRVIKNFFSDDQLRATFVPYADAIDIERYPECRRVVVGYTLRA